MQGYNFERIEIQLAHQEGNSVQAAYNDARYLEPDTLGPGPG